MARFRLSNTDILSPLNSDISLNDGSAFSFGSLSGTPVFDNTFPSPICSASTKDSDLNLLCGKTMKECTGAFDEITNAFKKQLDIDSRKAEKYKETYQDLKKSMDDLFGKNSTSSLSSTQSMADESKNASHKSKMHSRMNAMNESLGSENTKLLRKNKCKSLENISKVTKKKSEACKQDKSFTDKLKKNSSEQTSLLSEPVKDTKIRSETHLSKEKKEALTDQKKDYKATSSKNDGTSFEKKKASSKIMPEKKKERTTGDIRNYQFKCQKKIPVPNYKPITEQKNLSVEKSIQLAVGMEMDNIRRFVLNQNLYMQKDLLKFQEMLEKQNEVTSYLFSVIDELLDTNRKLISNYE